MPFIILIAILFVLLFLLSKSIYIVRQTEAIIIERFGKYNRVITSGIHFVIPIIEDPHRAIWTSVIRDHITKKYNRHNYLVERLDLRESVYDFPKQHVITKDNVGIEINSVIYYKIFDPYYAIYGVSNLPEAIEKLTQTTLRNVIGSMDLDEALVSRDAINEKLRHILDEATYRWGVHVNRVELQDINPPADIQHAMEKQMRAERDRRAVILESEGKKRAAILEAEGAKEAQILRAIGLAKSIFIEAEARAKSRIEIAKAEAESIRLIAEANPGKDPIQYIIAEKYIKAFSDAVKENKGATVIPYEYSSIASSLSVMKKIINEN
jgi:regulator of protease activity HflC (stomatin/prohibitin superfamily)